MKLRFNLLALLAALPLTALHALTPTLSVGAASLHIDPTATDSYNLQGAYTGLDFRHAQSVTLQVGPYSATILKSAFVEQPPNVFTYTDSTGQTPYWITSVSIDTNAGAFSAQSSGVVLAGIANPFAVQLGTEQGSGCSMARVQQSDIGSYQLSPGDGSNEPCQIPVAPVAEPPVIPPGEIANVRFQIELIPTLGLDPATLQVFRADDNAQPAGAPLCTLSDNGAGTFSCTASFSEAAPGMIPLLVQAAAGNLTILSPGFSLQVAGPPDDSDNQQLSDIQDAIAQAQPNFAQFGDSAYARIQTMMALRALLQAQPRLTGQPVELCPDGVSIGVRSRSGVVVIDYLLNDIGPGDVGASAALLPRFGRPRTVVHASVGRKAGLSSQTIGPQAIGPQQCGNPQYDIVQNNKVLLWDPGSVFFGLHDPGPPMAFTASKCPRFELDTIAGENASPPTLGLFPLYGTVIVSTHGGVDPFHRGLIVTGEKAPRGITEDVYSMTADKGISCVGYGWLVGSSFKPPSGCFVHVYASYIAKVVQGQRNSIILAGACYSASPDLAQAFAPTDSQNAYFSFNGVSYVDEWPKVSSAIFDSLINQYSNTLDAFGTIPKLPLGSVPVRYTNPNLAYLGNPVLNAGGQPGDSPYMLRPGDTLNLQAGLDGASSCGGVMNYHWNNSAIAGHLTSTSGAQQDDFTVTDSDATYQTSGTSKGIDTIMVDFSPDPSNPPAARACSGTDVTSQNILRIVFDGTGEATYSFLPPSDFNHTDTSANVTWHAAWDVTIPFVTMGFPGQSNAGPSLPGTTVTGKTTVNHTSNIGVCANKPPVPNPYHGFGSSTVPQSPFIGVSSDYNNPPPNAPVPMWVETFGGADYDLCDGITPMVVGPYGTEPGYPGLIPSHAKFNLDLSQWVNQPPHTMMIPIEGELSSSNGIQTGFANWKGTLTITSRAINASKATMGGVIGKTK